MGKSVAAKIFGGFVLSLLFSGAIFLVSLIAISNINGSLHSLADESVPLVETGGQVSSTLLEAEIELLSLADTRSLSKIKTYAQSYQALVASNRKHITTLIELSASSVALSDLSARTVSSSEDFFTRADKVIETHVAAITADADMRELASDFSDMADEILSNSYDLEGIASLQRSINNSAKMISIIDRIVETADGLKSSGIKMEVLSIKSDIQGDIQELDDLLQRLNRAGDLAGTEEMAAITEAYGHFKTALVGQGNIINSKIASLEKVADSKTLLNAAKEASKVAIEALHKLNDSIHTNSEATKEAAASTVARSTWLISVIALVALASSVGVALWVVRTIKGPLKDVTSKIKLLTEGDLTPEFTRHSDDELGDLADDMRLLTQSLRDVVQQISSNSEMLAATAEETTAISDQSFANINQQKEQTEMIASSINQMSSTVDEVAASITATQGQVQTVQEEVTEGQSLLGANISRIQQLSEETQAAVDVIGRLNEDTGNISEVLEVIRSVAEQTNLLALNAAIEAARAGDQGRGFAVVADEVRSLASRTHNSTEEINQLIERLLAGSKKAVDVMAHAQGRTIECVQGIEGVGNMLNTVASSITTINDMSLQIASAAEQQSVTANTQNESISHIAQIAEQTSESARENQVASQDLARMAETQMALVKQFRF